MKYAALAIAGMIACSFASCAGRDAAGLVGVWRSSEPVSQLPSSSGESTESVEASADSWIILEFTRSGRLATITRMHSIQTEKDGTWIWLGYDSASRVGAIQCRLMGQKTDHKIRFVDADTILLTPPNMAGLELELRFERVR